eukprot:28752_1
MGNCGCASISTPEIKKCDIGREVNKKSMILRDEFMSNQHEFRDEIQKHAPEPWEIPHMKGVTATYGEVTDKEIDDLALQSAFAEENRENLKTNIWDEFSSNIKDEIPQNANYFAKRNVMKTAKQEVDVIIDDQLDKIVSNLQMGCLGKSRA